MLDVARRRVLLVSTNYAPEHAGIGPYATALAEAWAATKRAEVHVLAGMPHYPSWQLDASYRGQKWWLTERRNGVCVHRRRHTVPSRQTALNRGLYEASILAHGVLAPPRTGRPDIVVAQVPSLAGGVLGARLARRFGVPFVPIVQDLMGAAAAQSGMSGGDKAAVVASTVERFMLRRARLVGVVHTSFVDPVAAFGVDPSAIRVVPNWSRVAAPRRPRAETRLRLGWPDSQPVLLHSGNMGLKQRLEVLLDLARLAPDVRVVLMGDGNQRGRLREHAAGLPNVEFRPPADESEFPEVMAAADALVLTQRATVADMSVPSKLTAYFASGRPVLASVAGGSGGAQEVTRAGAGVVVEPEDPAALLAELRRLLADPATVNELGGSGVRYVQQYLGPEAGIGRITALLDEAMTDG